MRSTRLLAAVASAAVLAFALSDFSTAQNAPTAIPAAAPACTAGTTVVAADGSVCGLTTDGVTNYLGIPFAAPPVGDLRWKAPEPAKPWTHELQATRPGNTCPSPGFRGISGNEDCLNLNVQVPAGTRADARLPVMVRIHGGGFLITAFGLHDSRNLAQHVIVVAMNYRIGILGFMAEKALGPNSGDYGLQDQQAALRWVQRNISHFGGDPQNVTIFGTSAGGASVCAHVISPTAKGLFQRGISRSGFYNSGVGPNEVWEPADCKTQWPTEAEAQSAGAALAAEVGCANVQDVAACLRKVPAATLVQKASGVYSTHAVGTIAPTINGTTIPMSPAKAFATGQVNNVSLIIGVDRDEINGGGTGASVAARTPEAYQRLIKQKYGSLAPRVMQLYPIERFPTPSAFLAFRTLVADADSVCPALTSMHNLARHIPVYGYEVDDAGAPVTYLGGNMPWGSYHGAGAASNPGPGGATSNQGQDADHLALTAQVVAAWTGFARNGDPTAPGAPYWPRFTHDDPMVMSLVAAGDSALVPASVLATQHHCAFWDSVTPTPKR